MEMDEISRQEHDRLLGPQDGLGSPVERSRAVVQTERVSPGLLQSRYVTICALFSALGGLLFGYDQGVVSIILVEEQFLQRFWQVAGDAPSAAFYKGLLTAMIELGALVGAFNQGWIADWLSRKYSIVLACTIFVLGSILQTCSTTYDALVLARFAGGIGIGMLSMVVPLYIAEISPPTIRGSLLVLEELSIVTGIVVAFWITYATRTIASELAWRLPFGLQIIPGLLLGVGILALPFSPRWLVAQDRGQDALQSLCRLRQLPETDSRVLEEWRAIKQEVDDNREMYQKKHSGMQDSSILQTELSQWADLFNEECWPRTQIGVGIMFFQQFVGINALIYYAPTMLRMLGLNYDMQLIMTGVINMSQLAGVTTSIWTMDRIGRRKLLMIGSGVMFFCHLIIAILVARFSHAWSTYDAAGWTCVMLLLTYMFVFGCSLAVVGWALPAEIFQTHMRAKGVAISTCSNWMNNFIIGLISPALVEYTGYGVYLFFACFCLACLIWTYFTVPETAGRSLEEIDQHFRDLAKRARDG